MSRAGLLIEAGRILPDGGTGLWAVSCGGCGSVKTLPRGLTREGAAATSRREGHTSIPHLGWLCPTCRFSFGVAPVVKVPEIGRAPAAPWRHVVMIQRNVVDASGRKLGPVAEVLSCGHTFIPRDGTPSANRRRRCLDCLHTEGGNVS